MISNIPLLDNIQVAAPCKAAWEHMEGDEQVRFCCECQKNVYNLSAMSRQEAEALLRKKEGNLCVRFYKRADGTILTDNCPVGLRGLRRQFLKQVAGIAGLSMLSSLFSRPASGQTTGVPMALPPRHETKPHSKPVPNVRSKPALSKPRTSVRHTTTGKISPRHPQTTETGQVRLDHPHASEKEK